GFVVNQKNAEKKTVLQKVNEEKKSKHTKIGACLTFTIHTKGSTTIIDWHNQNKHSKNFSINQKTQIYRLRNWQRRIKATGSAERNLTYALTEITKTANNLDIPKNVLETATVIYRKAVKERLINGRSIQCIATASLYLACRQCGHPKTFNDIAYTSTVNKKKLGKDYRFLIKRLNYSTPPLQPNQYVAKFSNKKLSQEKIEEITHKILVAAKDNKLTAGRSPIGIAAAASYIALILIDERKTQKEIADIAQTTETTIKNRYKELVNRLMFEISL
ncbi:MAG: transcription initiation factor IIB, partial [Nitrososphaerota archaeon]|nr:transcription initiation factor IIB [Nitrososphaerota archaeon]